MPRQSNVNKALIPPSKHPSASDPNLPSHHLSHAPSSTSLAHSEGDTPLFASNIVQEPSAIDLPDRSDIIIAVIGPTGAGKSTFINKAAGIEGTEVGHGLQSCTDKVQIVRFLDTRQNRRVVFVDTPGFNDTNISDLDILQGVANWLKVTYQKDIRLSGLLFFRPISDNRMTGSSIKYLKMFQNLCGDEALKNVVLVTTMWDKVEEEEGRNRETELCTKYWNLMLERGCHTSRFYNNTESALDIVSRFQGARCTVLLQKELVDLGLDLPETSAGRTLFSMLIEFIKRIQEFLAYIEAKLKQNQSSANRGVVAEERTAMEAVLRDAVAQRRRYSSSVFRRLSNSRQRPSTQVNDRQTSVSPVSPASPTLSHPAASDNISNIASRSRTALRAATSPRANTSGRLASLPSTAPPPSPADTNSTIEAYSGTALKGTITALKLVHQIVGLAPVPGLQSLIGLVLNISEIVNNMYTAEEALIELAQKAGSFMVTLVEQEAISSLSDSDAMKSVIEGLTKEMKRVLRVVRKISSQRTAKRLILSAFDKMAVDDCNRQMALACGIFGIHIAFISQQAIARIEAKLNAALNLNIQMDSIPSLSNQHDTALAARRATTC